MKSTLISLFLFLYSFAEAQNVGVGTAAPTEKLDVNGNINLTGTIKANGVDGAAGQVLMKGTGGQVVWGDLSEYKHFETFKSPGSGTWTIPVGVTKIFVEAWGGGGGGSGFGGGGGGGYVCAYFTVTPGATVSYTVGDNGAGGNNGSNLATAGNHSTVTSAGVTVTANGGSASLVYDAVAPYGIYGASGGGFTVTPSTFRNYAGRSGEDGQPNQLQYFQSSSTTYLEATVSGKGGDAGNAANTGARGSYLLYSLTAGASLRYVSTGNAAQPGGGGGGNYAQASYYGGAGAEGMVVIRY